MQTFMVKVGKSQDEMTFDECMAHIKRVLFWGYIDGGWCDVVPLSDRRWEELAGYISGAHERGVDALMAENFKLRELVNDMWICVSHGSGWDCTGCRRDPDSVCILGISEFSQRMRNLGIEAECETNTDAL